MSLSDWLKAAQQRTRAELTSALESLGRDAVKYAENEARLIRSSGEYQRSFAFKVDPRTLTLEVFNKSPHAGFVETGRKRGSAPPTSEIKRWVSLTLGLPPNVPKTTQIAFAIARSIALHGIKARPVLAKTFDYLQTEYQKRFPSVLGKIFR